MILSPSNYWFMAARLQTGSARRARQMADGLMRPRPEAFKRVVVYGKKGAYECYAYDGAALKAALEAQGLADVPVWFLQRFASRAPFRLDSERVAEKIGDVLIERIDKAADYPTFVAAWTQQVAPLRLEEKTEDRSWRRLALLAAAAALLDLGVRWQEAAALKEAIDSVWRGRTGYETAALIKKYEKMQKQERSLFEALQSALPSFGEGSLICTPKGCRRE